MAKKNKNQNEKLDNNEENIVENIIEAEVLEEQAEIEVSEVIIEDELKKENTITETDKTVLEDNNKINIIDVSKKREENKRRELYSKLEGFTTNLGFSDTESITEKVFDSLIFMGGGFIASTNLATKTISSLVEKVIK